MAAAYERVRDIGYIGGFKLRVKVPHSYFTWASAFSPQYGVQLVGKDDMSWVNYQSFGQSISDWDRRLVMFSSRKEFSEQQANRFLDMSSEILQVAWNSRRTLTLEQVRALSLEYLYDGQNEDNKQHYRHYEVKFLGNRLIGTTFPKWEQTRGSTNVEIKIEALMARLFRKIPLLVYEYQQNNKWPGT